MVLLASLAQAADLTVVLSIGDEQHLVTFAGARPGPIPSLVIADPQGEVRLDLDLTVFEFEKIAFDYRLTRSGKKPVVLGQGTLNGGGTDIPLAASGGPGGTLIYQLAAYEGPTGGTVETGPLAGCQWRRQLGMTDVACPTGGVRYHHVHDRAYDEMEAGLARARASGASGGRKQLVVAGRTVDGFEVLFPPVTGEATTTVITWLGPDSLDEVRCVATDEAACLGLLGAFAGGLPTSLR